MRKILFILVIAYFCAAFACNNSGGTSNPCAAKPIPKDCYESVTIPPNVNDHVITTPGGVTIRSVVDVPLQAQLALDQAAQADIATYAQFFPQWTKYRTLPEFTVFVIEPDHYSTEADPGAGLINVAYSTGTLNGVPTGRATVSSAGTCIGCPGSGYSGTPAAVIPEQGPSWEHLRMFREAAFNEWQHAIECANDAGGVCMQFAIVADQHPHFGPDIWSMDLPTVPASKKK